MKRLLGIVLAAVSMTAAADGVMYDGEFYADTKASASSRSPWVHPTNVVNIADRRIEAYWENILRPLYMPSGLSAINLYNSERYPSSVYGSFNINLGIDNVTGDPLKPQKDTKYSVTIGTSSRAEKMHSYTFGSQINSVAANSTVIGYGASSTSDWSTVIGHGKRPSTSGTDYDRNFASVAAMNEWLKKYDPNVFPGIHFMNNSDKKLYTITEVSTTPDNNGYYYKFVETSTTVIESIPKGTKLTAGTIFYTNTVSGVYAEAIVPAGTTYTANGTEQIRKSYDHIPGGYDWRYGKSHGPGTFNIVAYHSRWGTKSPGMKAVYINDDCLENLVDTKIKTVAPAALGPQEMVLDGDQILDSYDKPIEVLSGSTVTILPTTNLNSGSELAVATKDNALRNYEVYVPNEPETRAGLPLNMDFELPTGIKSTIVNGINQAHKLPAKITVKQPYSKFVLAEITEYDDGSDWSPIITKANLLWKDGKIVANGSKLLEGTNLHSGVSLKYVYAISTGAIVTNKVEASMNDQGIMTGTFYDNTISVDFVPPTGQEPSPSGGTTAPITIIYETKCGKKPGVFTTDLEMISL